MFIKGSFDGSLMFVSMLVSDYECGISFHFIMGDFFFHILLISHSL